VLVQVQCDRSLKFLSFGSILQQIEIPLDKTLFSVRLDWALLILFALWNFDNKTAIGHFERLFEKFVHIRNWLSFFF
jgi:hypothetical protein